MDSLWNKVFLPRTREDFSYHQVVLDIDAREREPIWENPSEDVSLEVKLLLLTWSYCLEVKKRSPDWPMSKRKTDSDQRELTKSENFSLFLSTLTTLESKTKFPSKSPTSMYNRLLLKESLKKSMVKNIIRLQESQDFWPAKDSEEKESKLPKNFPL